MRIAPWHSPAAAGSLLAASSGAARRARPPVPCTVGAPRLGPAGRLRATIQLMHVQQRDCAQSLIPFLARFPTALIAKKLREFHDLHVPGPNDISLWQRLRRWLQEAHSRCSPEEAREFRLEKMGGEVAMLENALSRVDQRVRFSHNDMQYVNIMIYEETKQVTLISFTDPWNMIWYLLSFADLWNMIWYEELGRQNLASC